MSTYKSRNGKNSVTAIRSMKGNAAAVQDFLQPGDGLSVQAGQGRIWLVDSAQKKKTVQEGEWVVRDDDTIRVMEHESFIANYAVEGTKAPPKPPRASKSESAASAKPAKPKKKLSPRAKKAPNKPEAEVEDAFASPDDDEDEDDEDEDEDDGAEPEVPTQHPSTPKPKTVAGREVRTILLLNGPDAINFKYQHPPTKDEVVSYINLFGSLIQELQRQVQ